ncbi:MAG: 2-oxo acid dehydrogenase subunit E2 [Thermoleophilia bacterium]|nr:2-oxo acid dehydrogenase subunit E2 [Thermoleophilia bacterium]
MATDTAVDVVMPQMGVSVSEGTITRWLRSEGETVAADEPLLEISTDKVDTEVPSPATGVLARILVAEGETVAVGTALATIVPPGANTPALPPAASEPQAAEAAPAGTAAGPVLAAPDLGNGEAGGRAFVSPVVARIAAEHGVDVSRVQGTGRAGRVTKQDILAHVAATPAAAATPAEAPPHLAPPAPPPPPAAAPVTATGASTGETVEPLSVMRRAIAEHMIRSVQTSAHVTCVFEIDMSRVVRIRDRLKREYEERHGVRLTYLPFVCRAVVDALAKWPRLNAEIRGDTLVTKSFVNLGIAVALDEGKGLIVPVIRNAEERNLLGLARAIADLAERARAKRLSPDEVRGGTFTITNPGGFGAVMGTPIINQPQVGIIDVEAVVKRPVVVTDAHGNDAIAIRPIMNLSLSYDHRLVDGAYAAPFMRDLRTSLETWEEEAY